MATQTVYQERRGELNQLVRGWDRRLRLQQVFTWLPRCLLPGVTIGVAIAIVSRLRPLLVSGQILLLTGILLALSIVVMLIAVWLWPRSSQVAARRFDILFGLQERVSTAMELIDGRIHADEQQAPSIEVKLPQITFGRHGVNHIRLTASELLFALERQLRISHA